MPVLGDVPICMLRIVGTHDSGTYHFDTDAPYTEDAPPTVLSMPKAMQKVAKSIVANWARCQSMDVKHQLLCGARYIDLRLAPENGSKGGGPLYIAHSLRGVTFASIVGQIVEFIVISATMCGGTCDEVFVVDLQHMIGFSSPRDEQGFIEAIAPLAPFLICKPFGPHFSVSQIKKAAKPSDSDKQHMKEVFGEKYCFVSSNIVLYCPKRDLVEKHCFLHLRNDDTIVNWWPNTNSTKRLVAMLEADAKSEMSRIDPSRTHRKGCQHCANSGVQLESQESEEPYWMPLYVSQGILTPTNGNVVKGLLSPFPWGSTSIQMFAQAVNSSVLHFFLLHNCITAQGKCCHNIHSNILLLDFFELGTTNWELPDGRVAAEVEAGKQLSQIFPAPHVGAIALCMNLNFSLWQN